MVFKFYLLDFGLLVPPYRSLLTFGHPNLLVMVGLDANVGNRSQDLSFSLKIVVNKYFHYDNLNKSGSKTVKIQIIATFEFDTTIFGLLILSKN